MRQTRCGQITSNAQTGGQPRISMGGARAGDRWPARRSPLVRQGLGRADICMEAHVSFRIRKCVPLLLFAAPLQNPPAEQRQFLYPNAVSTCRREVGFHTVLRSRIVFTNPLEREHPEAHFVSEAIEDILHRLFLSFGHSGRGTGRLKVGSYSRTRRPCRAGRSAASQTSKTNPVGARRISDEPKSTR